MNVSIIGPGTMGKAIAARALAGGHDVTIVGKDADQARAAAEEVGAQAGERPEGDVVVLAVYYNDSLQAVEQYADDIAGKVVVDICNPLNESFSDMVDTPAGSAAEEIAAKAPEGTKVVKAFNTTFGNTVKPGEVAGQPLDVLIAGDDEEAKSQVAQLVEGGGMRAVDAGPLARARELEHLGFLHISLQGTLGTGFGSAVKLIS